jgi:hypothetical protein
MRIRWATVAEHADFMPVTKKVSLRVGRLGEASGPGSSLCLSSGQAP